MGKHLKFTNEAAAKACLYAINLMATSYLSAQGFDFVKKSIAFEAEGEE